MTNNVNGSYISEELKFWTPVKYGDLAQTKTHKAIEKVDEYFNLGGRIATVVSLPASGSSITQVRLQDNRPHFFFTVLKVVSYATLIIPTLMFLAKLILRLSHSFMVTTSLQPLPKPFSPPPGGIPLPGMTTQPNPQPLKPTTLESQTAIPVPTSSDPATAQLLENYKLAGNAKRYSELMEQIYSNIPNPDDLQLFGLPDHLRTLGTHGTEAGQPNRISNNTINFFQDLVTKVEGHAPLTAWEDRFLKMTIATYDAIMKQEGEELESGKEILITAINNGFSNCINRKSTEIETLYFQYVAPERLKAVQNAATPEECFIFELMKFRAGLREEIINTICYDQHNAASHKFFRKKLDKAIFYLPPPPLSIEDSQYENFAMRNNNEENRIINTFRTRYEDPKTIYNLFFALLYPKERAKHQFKPEMFTQWLEMNGLMNADAFADVDEGIYKPEIIVRYLTEKGFLKHK